MDVLTYCEREFKKRGYQIDAAQQAAIERLQHCYLGWIEYQARQSHLIKKWIRTQAPKGVYLWGGVGRGKSFLMDAFYACAPLKKKVRLHFHAFMRDVHAQLQTLKGCANPLDALAVRMAKRYRLICFDEFHITDIADAMLLDRLLHALFKQGVQFVITSNDQPDLLYLDGLHRDRMLSAIALIYEQLDVLRVDTGVDYRHQQDQLVTNSSYPHPLTYHTPLAPQTRAVLWDMFKTLSSTVQPDHRASVVPDTPIILHIQHRDLLAQACASGVVWFEFQTLCGEARSQNDYLDIAKRFHTVLVSNVPQFTEEKTLAARRFTWLIDVLYDTHTRLIVSVEVPLSDLYISPKLAKQCTRTLSRLTEMQTLQYWEARIT